NSPRKGKPFFAINCAAIPETLLESELFGYEKGAFTGAMARHTGLFEQANGSTLFLDEIGDLTQNTQAKLLRVLQEKEVRRIGGNEMIKLDVRIIAATNKKLEKEIEDGKFREDLYYRLNVIAFTLPPLRERPTDIPLLAEHFLKKLDETHNSKKTISDEVLQYLMQYTWPGNVRQLESVIERSYILCETGIIGMEHVPAEVRQQAKPRNELGKLTSMLEDLINAKLTAAEYRLYLYLKKLDEDGRSSGHTFEPKDIAEHLGINRDTFFVGVSKLKELDLYDYKARLNELKQGKTSVKKH
ncbi:MAG: sigma-54 dependent transcriptional regulator, partial [Syntrophorhabdus sp.]